MVADADLPLTAWLADAHAGDAVAAERAWRVLYPELRRIAHARLRSQHTLTLLDTEALVHESFLRLVQAAPRHLASRKHFYAYAATAMRHIVVDFVRRRRAARRGGGQDTLPLDTAATEALAAGARPDLLAVDAALDALERLDPLLTTLVELRCFGGYTDAETAAALDISERTVRRHWNKARAFLLVQLGGA